MAFLGKQCLCQPPSNQALFLCLPQNEDLLAGSISSCLAATPFDGGLGRTPSSGLTGTPAHGLGGACSTWLPCARSLHSLGTRRDSLPPPHSSGY